MSDQEIVNRVRGGCGEVVSFLYDKYYKMGINIVMKNNGNIHDARDVYQEAVLIMWQKIIVDDFILSAKLGTFFYGICNNLWLKELSRRRRYSEEDVSEIIESSPPTIESEEIKNIIHDSLKNLSESDRKILSYFYIENKTMEEIGNILGYSNPNSAKVKKFRAKEALSEIIKSKYKHTDLID